jgi:Uma2 family endonuclease
MPTTAVLGEQKYRELALNDEDGFWELWSGVPRQKPGMSVKHDDVSSYLGFALAKRLDRSHYRINVNGGRARLSARDYYIPDVIVIPAAYQWPYENDPQALGAYGEPLPLVVDVWSWTAESYDFATKLQGYRQRGDLEIWFIHPYERTLTVWRRQPDGSYAEALYRGGSISVASLLGVTIDFDALLDG